MERSAVKDEVKDHPLTKVIEGALRRRTYVERQDKTGTAIAITEAVLAHLREGEEGKVDPRSASE